MHIVCFSLTHQVLKMKTKVLIRYISPYSAASALQVSLGEFIQPDAISAQGSVFYRALVILHAQFEWGKVISVGVHIYNVYTYIGILWTKKNWIVL